MIDGQRQVYISHASNPGFFQRLSERAQLDKAEQICISLLYHPKMHMVMTQTTHQSMVSEEPPPPYEQSLTPSRPPFHAYEEVHPAYDQSGSTEASDLDCSTVTASHSSTTLSAPTNQLSIPSRNPFQFSFPYYAALQSFNISPAQWTLFTQELEAAASTNISQKALAISTGIAAGVVIMEPWTASLFGRMVWRSQVVKNVLKGEHDREKECVSTVLLRWNDLFAEQGVKVRLELPKRNPKKQERTECDMTFQSARDCASCGNCEFSQCCGSRKGCTRFQGCRRRKRSCCGRQHQGFKVVVEKLDAGSVVRPKEHSHTRE